MLYVKMPKKWTTNDPNETQKHIFITSEQKKEQRCFPKKEVMTTKPG